MLGRSYQPGSGGSGEPHRLGPRDHLQYRGPQSEATCRRVGPTVPRGLGGGAGAVVVSYNLVTGDEARRARAAPALMASTSGRRDRGGVHSASKLTDLSDQDLPSPFLLLADRRSPGSQPVLRSDSRVVDSSVCRVTVAPRPDHL